MTSNDAARQVAAKAKHLRKCYQRLGMRYAEAALAARYASQPYILWDAGTENEVGAALFKSAKLRGMPECGGCGCVCDPDGGGGVCVCDLACEFCSMNEEQRRERARAR